MTVASSLPSALHAALRGLELAYTEEGADSTHLPSVDLWANLLRAIDPAGIDRRELCAILRLSKRALRTRVSAAVRRGWVEEIKTDRSGLVCLTSNGSAVAARWEDLQPAAEDRWKSVVGLRSFNKLRASLEGIVAAFPLEHPHYPASYGPADASITGGNGVDWKPVYRSSANTVSDLSLSALISQAIVAFAIQYEELSPVAYSLSATVIRQISAEGRPLRELGHSAGVSALIRHGFVRASGPSSREIAHLTARGFEVQRDYKKRIHSVEASWRHQFGEDRVQALVCALEETRLRQGSVHPG